MELLEVNDGGDTILLSHDLKEKKQQHFNVFKENVSNIHKVNKMDKPDKYKLNKFANMTDQESVNTYTYGGSKLGHYRMLRDKKRGTGEFMHGKTEELTDYLLEEEWNRESVTGIKGSMQMC